MATRRWLRRTLFIASILALPFSGFSDRAAIQREIDLIREQNQVLQQQLKTLADKVTVLESKRNGSEIQHDYISNDKTNSSAFPTVKLGAQGGLGLAYEDFGGTTGFFVDDVKVSLAAQLGRKIDFFTDINLNTLDHYPPNFYAAYAPNNSSLSLNEIYVDFHGLLEPFGYDNWLNVRAGQFYIPFGEEYAVRYPFDNPLIWRSAMDLWGLSPGLEVYGGSGKWSYVLAIQNRAGGTEGFDANEHFNISAS